ncbi:carboxypeptidase-like regulatory domain-containing protein [Chloroflexia bacterium SDU3-3]|nr:carboxypeptidase-like regulatory domain-containing protein [Chloroflexia bacterium SDU3-3]
MRIKTFATLGLAGGMLALAFSLGIPAANGAPASAPLLQPSPRPTLIPTSTARPTATTAATAVATTVATAKPHATSTSKNNSKEEVVRYGHITGTVIDERTGAPVSYVKVMVGSYTLMTDVSGNYDLWVPTGTYDVVLSLTGGQGTPVHASSKVTIKADTTTVEHLSFRSAAPAVAAPAEIAPVVAPDTAVAPVVVEAPVAEAPAKAPTLTAKESPERLPTTGEGDSLPMMVMWVAVVLVLMGGLLAIPPVRLALVPMFGASHTNKAADERLLSRLIGAKSAKTDEEDRAFLDDLLK